MKLGAHSQLGPLIFACMKVILKVPERLPDVLRTVRAACKAVHRDLLHHDHGR